MKEIEKHPWQGEAGAFVLPAWRQYLRPTFQQNYSPCVYRMYADDGTLLYIGQTAEIPRRLLQHRLERPWFREVVIVKIEHMGSPEEARNFERVAIQRENPKYNIYGTDKRDYRAATEKGRRTKEENSAKALMMASKDGYPAELRATFSYVSAQLYRRYFGGELSEIGSSTRVDLLTMARMINEQWDGVDPKTFERVYKFLLETEYQKSLFHMVVIPKKMLTKKQKKLED